ncbi:MAG TPA: ABC transporter substrate-binding protein [Hydrogenophaga sp.]|nr:ABC transporter substrate-binding protein [Hydrogenophaga sp.]
MGAGAVVAMSAVQAQEIVVGQIGPFTVLPAPDAHEINKGAKAYFAQVNARGGVNGRRIAFFEVDDKYSPDEFARQLELAMQRKPVALLSPVGSATMQKVLQDKLLDKHDVLILNAVPGAEVLRAPGHPRLFHVRAGDRQQLQKIVQHARTLGVSRLHVLHQNIPIGTSGLEMVQAAAQGVPAMEVGATESGPEEAAIAAAAKAVAAGDSQSVVIIGSPKFMADAITQLRRANVTQQIFALSYVPPGLIARLAGEEAARGVGIAQTYPNPMGVTLPLQREFAAAMKALDPALSQYSGFHLEGYIVARVLVEGLRRSGGDIRPETLARGLRTAGEMDFAGYRVNFSKDNTGSGFVDIGVVTSGGRLRY